MRNIEATGEFYWNLASWDLAQQMNSTAAVVPPDVDEFQLAGLSPRTSRTISAPHAAEAKAVFECRLTQVMPLVSASGEQPVTCMVFGEVVGVHIERSLLKEGIFQTAQADPLLRGGGPADYSGSAEKTCCACTARKLSSCHAGTLPGLRAFTCPYTPG